MAKTSKIKRITFIINGSKKKAIDRVDLLTRKMGVSYEINVVSTWAKGDGITLAAHWAATCDLILAVGGDGTLNEVVQGIMLVEEEMRKNLTLGLLPQGSGNDFARNFGWSSSIDALLERIRGENTIDCDVFSIQNSRSEKEHFINIADAGMGPAVVKNVNTLPPWWNGKLKFGFSILKTFIGYKKTFYEVKMDGVIWSGKALTVVVANGKYFGSGLGIAPDADLGDGLAEVVIIGNVSILTYLKKILLLRKCQRIEHPEIFYSKARVVEIKGPDEMEKDGELGMALPVKIECAGKINVLV
jgi:diacylglycerol kinase (ATP)